MLDDDFLSHHNHFGVSAPCPHPRIATTVERQQLTASVAKARLSLAAKAYSSTVQCCRSFDSNCYVQNTVNQILVCSQLLRLLQPAPTHPIQRHFLCRVFQCAVPNREPPTKPCISLPFSPANPRRISILIASTCSPLPPSTVSEV